MKKILSIAVLMMFLPVLVSAVELNNIRSQGVDGDLVFYDNSGTEIARFDESAATLDITKWAIGGTAVNATAAEINMAADISANAEVVTATNIITAEESGKTFFLDAAAGFASTLPAPAAGLKFSFIVKTAPTSNGYTIVTNGTTQKVLKGLVVVAADAVGDVSAGGTTATFVHNQALPGDRVDVICDGTIWYMVGYAQVAAGLTITGE
ncbi:MAG: hypothetical protein A4E65_03697 [Syntrophorhabdus sp. PtaU1.Bin153]|nr:MAG: hypothetical protein A4E65_03697 [Syntrophorhabdus sp. PtaU1.Bin153]